MEFGLEINVIESFQRVMESSPETGAALGGALLLFLILLCYRYYHGRDPLATYTPDFVALSLSALISAIVAVGAIAKIKTPIDSAGADATHRMTDWVFLLISCGVITMLFWFLSLDWAQKVALRKRDHLIACTLGWALVDPRLGDKRRIRNRFREFAEKAKSGTWTDFFFDQELRLGLKRLKSKGSLTQSVEDMKLLETHITGEESLVGDWLHVVVNTHWCPVNFGEGLKALSLVRLRALPKRTLFLGGNRGGSEVKPPWLW